MTAAELLARADAAAEKAYAPYSQFNVGCAVLTRDGRVVEGANVENSAYPLGVCAERTAFARAISEGFRPGDFVTAAITASPCGGCRQWLLEMGVEAGRVPKRRPCRHDDARGAPAGGLRGVGSPVSLWSDSHAFGTKSCVLRARFLVTIAVGGGMGCPYERCP